MAAASASSLNSHKVSQVYCLCLGVHWLQLGDPGRNWKLCTEITQLPAASWHIKKWQSP